MGKKDGRKEGRQKGSGPQRNPLLSQKAIGKKGRKEGRKKGSGPHLPSSFRKEIDLLNPNPKSPESGSDGGVGDVREDVYEYEEPLPQEESKKNRRFDSVENYEYEFPAEFEDEDVPSDDEEDEDIPSDKSDEEEERDRHLRMLQGITGMPGEAFEGKEKKKAVLVDFQGDVGDEQISIHDLLDPLHDKPGYSKLRRRLDHLEMKQMPLQAPLSKVAREKLERKVAYEHSKKDITKWEPLVKRNREAPTLYFDEDVNLGFSTVGAIASKFEPRTEFEKKMALLVQDPKVMEAHEKDGSRLLELNKISVEDVKDHQNRLAKMRSLLFRHEMKAKHVKKIKSKTYHRILKKEKLKAASAEMQMDPEAAKDYAMKQEFKRAEERMTLKHKNNSKWARRILQRGLEVQDEGTRAAIADQLHKHELLTRKVNSMKDASSSDDSSDEDSEDLSPRTSTERASKLLNRAKEKTANVMEEEDEIPKSGVFALPFMERGLKKRQEAAYEEARLALQEYDKALRQLEDDDETEGPKLAKVSGRKVFGGAKKQPQGSNKRMSSDNVGTSDSEDDIEATEHEEVGLGVNSESQEVQVGSSLRDESEMGQDAVFKSFDGIIKNPGPKTTYEVAIFASNSWKKMTCENAVNSTAAQAKAVENPPIPAQDIKETDQNSDSDSDEEMVDGFLSSNAKTDYELPSQADLIHRAFAGDDVEAEFEKDKMELLNEENPEPEKPVLVPGWGQWTYVQQKKGMPSWMIEEHNNAKRKREEALKKRKDAKLKHVIISEKTDKKAEKLLAKNLPRPYTSKEAYEQSIRMPIGPDYNPAISVRALNRPEVVKRAGIIIKPIQFEEVDPYDKLEEPKRKANKTISAGFPSSKKRK
ncbi:uncharacterized protein C57A7.06 [Phoenix dactylifera]|uniref:Uncharacterized protein C57A7.06 n=1 Tax=Phoenix dactylifera TaxID=42345 RepID=A0A8B7BT42_PHODC|nr:uncharacterized protein C57A7.06 [Phoenix dactylifera]